MDIIDRLAEQWAASGVERGDTLLVHSNIKRTLRTYRKAGVLVSPQEILDSFLAALGSKGTLLLPLFNFDFAQGVPFDIRHTPSRMGAMTEAGRTHPGAVRTGHPMYSFAAIGSLAHKFSGIDNVSGYGDDSPFGILHALDGRIAVLDLADGESMTFYHHVEEVKQVPYRHFKEFTGPYVDAHGESSVRTYKVYVRNLDQGVVTNVTRAAAMMWDGGLWRGCRPNEGSGLRTIRASDMFTFLARLIDNGETLDTFYSIVPPT